MSVGFSSVEDVRNLTCLSTFKAHLQHLADSRVKILGKSKNLKMNKTEISLNIILIRYYVVFLVSLLTALGICRIIRFCRLLHCHHVKLNVCRFVRVMHS